MYVLMSTFYFYLTIILVPPHCCTFLQLWGLSAGSSPTTIRSCKIEIHRHEADTSRIGLLEVGTNQLSPDEARRREIEAHRFCFRLPRL
ncbi:hypothetical protein OROMI_030227 [Orobanche minor]